MERYQEILEKFKMPIALSLLGIVLVIGGLSLTPKPKKEYPKESIVQIKEENLVVDISGAVVNPGVYKLKEGSRIEDAINAAGGLLEDSNEEYMSKYLNKAQKVTDGIKVYVPFQEEKPTIPQNTTNIIGINSAASINLNTATQAQLEGLPGIGPVTASKIISNRPYQKIEDLLSKKIISKSTFEKIKSGVSVY